MTTYELYSLKYKDDMTDLIEESYVYLLQYMSIQEADVCWSYLEEHYYYNNYYGET